MSVWWRLGSVDLWHMPDGLTPDDREWVARHLRLAGLRDDDPPSNTAAGLAHRLSTLAGDPGSCWVVYEAA